METKQEQNTTREIRKRVKEIKKPYVMVNKKIGILSIIYINRVENYKLHKVETKKQIEESNGENCCYEYEKIYGKGWNKEHEYELLKDNGFHQISLKDEIDKEMIENIKRKLTLLNIEPDVYIKIIEIIREGYF